MLSTEDNELLCRVGPGTPMGALMREYWLPAFVPSELADPDGAPVRMRLLGENLIAFRITSGKYGLMAHSCPHRGASLFFGRNEEEGIRCVYHGWKFDVQGNCVDMPNEPAESDFKTKIKATAYPCVERNGIVWTYMGPRETPPPLPDWLPNLDADCQVWMRLQESNWLQALEGDIDTVHAFFLHFRAHQNGAEPAWVAMPTTSPSSATDASWPRSTRSARATRRYDAPSPARSTGAWATSCCPSTR